MVTSLQLYDSSGFSDYGNLILTVVCVFTSSFNKTPILSTTLGAVFEVTRLL